MDLSVLGSINIDLWLVRHELHVIGESVSGPVYEFRGRIDIIVVQNLWTWVVNFYLLQNEDEN